KKGARLAYAPIAQRGGMVSQLGVSPDGRYLLFDQGKTLQLLTVADGATTAVLENCPAGGSFATLALFGPDGSLMLTCGTDAGRLRLWKTPGPAERGHLLRELVARKGDTVTCASLAPTGANFAVSGSQDGHVHVWELPDAAAVQKHRIVVD